VLALHPKLCFVASWLHCAVCSVGALPEGFEYVSIFLHSEEDAATGRFFGDAVELTPFPVGDIESHCTVMETVHARTDTAQPTSSEVVIKDFEIVSDYDE
jgi:hypothetical protein